MSIHKTFISYHHKNDQQYKEWLVNNFKDWGFVDHSVGDGDIDDSINTETIRQKIRDEFLSDSTVTLVLIGNETWKRKHVDWEIGSSLRHTKNNPRSGLVGLILPSRKEEYGTGKYTPNTIPPRLYDNHQNGYAYIYDFPNIDVKRRYSSTELNDVRNFLIQIIDLAFKNKDKVIPDNSRDRFAKNRTTDSWS
jgi:hypothetical protein